MTEQLISLETAKLAKEKGFSNGSENYYNLRYGDIRTVGEGNSGFAAQTRPSNANNMFAIAEAPTQSVLQKWLRDEHKIYVSPMFVGPDTNLYHYRLDAFGQTAEYSDWFETWEECLEAGLKESLSLL